MPYHKMTFIVKASDRTQDQSMTVYRQYAESDIEKVWQKVENKCQQKWPGKLKNFNCCMFSKSSEDYQVYLKELTAAKA